MFPKANIVERVIPSCCAVGGSRLRGPGPEPGLGNTTQRRRGVSGKWWGQKPGRQVTIVTGWSNGGGPELVWIATHRRWSLQSLGAQPSAWKLRHTRHKRHVAGSKKRTAAWRLFLTQPPLPCISFHPSQSQLRASLTHSPGMLPLSHCLFRFPCGSREHTELWLWHIYDTQPQWKNLQGESS